MFSSNKTVDHSNEEEEKEETSFDISSNGDRKPWKTNNTSA